jgi:formate hydrogenlyase transcriptional activator
MKKAERTHQQLLNELQEVTRRMMEAEETLRAIRGGEVDSLVVSTPGGDRVFTLSGATHPYQVMVETMNEGAVTLTADGIILFCNQRFANIVRKNLEKVMGSVINRYISPRDLPLFKALVEQGLQGYSKMELVLKTGAENGTPVLLSVGPLQSRDVPGGVCMVVTDLTEQKRSEEQRTVEMRSALVEISALKEQLEVENIYFRQESKMKHRFENILGKSDGLKYVLYRAEQVARADTTVLIHNMSTRKERPLITVNCAALPGNLIESELFGRERGAFTGADTRQIGRFEVAHGSTLCLDEIGELPLEVQAKLLRVIQHKEFERLGSSHTVKVDVRIVATTNRNLEEEVRKGSFRQDLYYRLNIFPITVPPLRQRKDDIPQMVEAFLERYAKKLGKQITSVRKETMKTLLDYSWPGNIRELESIIERAVILCPGPVLHLTDKLEVASPALSATLRTLEETERNQILKILSETRWCIEGMDGAAAILGLHPSTLRARMHKLAIARPETKEPD